jgi:hypothetical protein
MARPRVPLIKAEITGRTIRNPRRFKDREEPTPSGPLGDPPKWFKTQGQKDAWNEFRDELPWLNKSHRALVAIASGIRARFTAGEDIGVKAINLLRMCLGQLGATPADASKVRMPVEKKDDPADKYF